MHVTDRSIAGQLLERELHQYMNSAVYIDTVEPYLTLSDFGYQSGVTTTSSRSYQHGHGRQRHFVTSRKQREKPYGCSFPHSDGAGSCP